MYDFMGEEGSIVHSWFWVMVRRNRKKRCCCCELSAFLFTDELYNNDYNATLVNPSPRIGRPEYIIEYFLINLVSTLPYYYSHGW